MIVRCETCKRFYDDFDHLTYCPHETFTASASAQAYLDEHAKHTPFIEPKHFVWESKDIMTYTCPTCVINFIVPIRLAEILLRDGDDMHCPNGHAHPVPA